MKISAQDETGGSRWEEFQLAGICQEQSSSQPRPVSLLKTAIQGQAGSLVLYAILRRQLCAADSTLYFRGLEEKHSQRQ
jgi:hypothetical protein